MDARFVDTMKKKTETGDAASQITGNADEMDRLIREAFHGTDANAVVRARVDKLLETDDVEGAAKLLTTAVENMALLMPPETSAANKVRTQMRIPLESWLFDEEADPAAVESALSSVSALSATLPAMSDADVMRKLGIGADAWNKHAGSATRK